MQSTVECDRGEGCVEGKHNENGFFEADAYYDCRHQFCGHGEHNCGIYFAASIYEAI